MTLYTGSPYVFALAGREQAATWRPEPGGQDNWKTTELPEVMFPEDRSWLVSFLRDDDRAGRAEGSNPGGGCRELTPAGVIAQRPGKHRGSDTTTGGLAMGIDDLVDKGKQEVEDRGGTDALKEDGSEVREDLGEQGSAADKAKDVAEDVKDPGAPGN